jgi:hypothetical protein
MLIDDDDDEVNTLSVYLLNDTSYTAIPALINHRRLGVDRSTLES